MALTGGDNMDIWHRLGRILYAFSNVVYETKRISG